jgi:hypothetical protein
MARGGASVRAGGVVMISAVDDHFDQALLRQAFGCFPSGVTAFCGLLDGAAEGMAASSFTSVSLDPALVSVRRQYIHYLAEAGQAHTSWAQRAGRRPRTHCAGAGREDR